MNRSKPLVSIMMCCFNGEKYLNKAIDSITNQTYANWELIFWDNQSTDRSKEIIENYKDRRIKYYYAEYHSNLGEARYKAAQKVQGDLLAFLDVDDLWNKNKLSKCVEVFENHKDVGIVYSNAKYFNHKNSYNIYNMTMPKDRITNKLICNYFLCLQTVMISVNKFNSLNTKFDKRFSHIADLDVFIRMSLITKVYFINEVLAGWRVHKDSLSFKRPELFFIEKIKWYYQYKDDSLMSNYSKEMREFYLISLAEKSMNNLKLHELTKINNLFDHKFSNRKNFFKYLLSSIPGGKIIYKVKVWLDNSKFF